jgi:Surface-adhesin protein E
MKLMIGKLMIIVATGLLLFGNAEVWGENWKFVLKNQAGDDGYYDADSVIRPSKGNVRVLTKVVFSEKSVNREVEKFGSSYKDMTHRVILFEMNCNEKKGAFLEVTTYSKKGTIISSIKPDEAIWTDNPPKSIGEGLYKLLCK